MANLSYIQDVMYEIAVHFHEFCDTHNIRYSVAGGSMIGAIRHKDFIPWDDDFDVVVPRDDIKIILENWVDIACQFGTIGLIKIGDPGYNKTAIPIKLHLKETRVAELDEVSFGMPEFNPYGIYLDIFPCDTVNDTWLTRFCNNHLGHIIQRKTQSQFHYKAFGRQFQFKLFLYRCVPQRLFDYLVPKLINALHVQNGDFVVYGLETPFDNLFLPSKDFFPLQQHCEIRGKMFYGVHHPHEYLTQRFGDYMVIPKEQDRQMHIINVAKLMEKDDA